MVMHVHRRYVTCRAAPPIAAPARVERCLGSPPRICTLRHDPLFKWAHSNRITHRDFPFTLGGLAQDVAAAPTRWPAANFASRASFTAARPGPILATPSLPRAHCTASSRVSSARSLPMHRTAKTSSRPQVCRRKLGAVNRLQSAKRTRYTSTSDADSTMTMVR